MSLLTRSFKPYTAERRAGTGGARTWSALTGRGYRGFIQPMSGNEVFQYQRSGEMSTHRLYTEVAADLVKGDKITDRNNNSYIVVFAEQPDGITGFRKHKEIRLQVFK